MLIRCLAMMRGGGETRHLAWIRELSQMGVEVDVITGEPLLLGEARFPVSELNATVLRSPYLRDWVYALQHTRGFGRLTMNALHLDEEWFCRAAWKQIAKRREQPHIVHAHALYQAARLRRGNAGVILNFPGEPNPRYHADIALADALIADGWAAKELPQRLNRPVLAVPKGVDYERFDPNGPNLRRELGLVDKQVVLSVGRFVPIKNMPLVIDGFAAAARTNPAAHLVLVGEGPEQGNLQSQVNQLQIASRVTFAGYVPQDQLGAYYRTADVFVLASEFDNSPNVVLEAMACATPVIATNVGGVAEYVVAPGGELVNRGDAQGLAAAIGGWLGNEERRQQAGAFNRDRIVRDFSWRASAKRLLDIYNMVLEQRQRAGAA